MPEYVYGCKEHGKQVMTVHGFFENPFMPCPECKKGMHRIPQLFSWGRSPANVMKDWLDDKYRNHEQRKEKSKKLAKSRLKSKKKRTLQTKR